ncbi:MAG: hypothetical protein HN725_21915 [Alphaproteobacteria bacterium]|jgi:hypothetical protein|nr:hypothetical protein [Alphaproteobacteria bacterium]MBT4083597.1 hypothetical protein [Alphaproteobacteria bacterium]MBT7747958.1 hypothetical protein [Alphaproteobacteria bacterium]
MNIMHAKLPLAPQDWTVKRGGNYLIKLAMFIIVPGLHQMACKRWIFGGLLMAIYFAAAFTAENLPFNLSDENYSSNFLAPNIMEYTRYLAWTLVAFDLKKLEERDLRPNLFLVLICIAGTYYLPEHYAGNLTVYVENENTVCPVFCKDDIIEYDWRTLEDLRKHRIRSEVSAGELLIANISHISTYATIVLATPEDICTGKTVKLLSLPDDKYYCDRGNFKGTLPYPYLVLGGPNPEYTGYGGEKISMVAGLIASGINARKIGNIREYYFWSDGVTEALGQVLLLVYKMTGLNLFELSGSS